jgi:hypothetical protein
MKSERPTAARNRGGSLELDDCLRSHLRLHLRLQHEAVCPAEKETAGRAVSALFLGKKVSFQEVRPSGRLRGTLGSLR